MIDILNMTIKINESDVQKSAHRFLYYVHENEHVVQRLILKGKV